MYVYVYVCVTNTCMFVVVAYVCMAVFLTVGEDLELRNVSIDGHLLAAEDYTVTPSSLTISSEVLSRFPMRFELSTEVQLCPRRNLALSGLYTSSSDLLCTQCEAMGFRRITYHLDR